MKYYEKTRKLLFEPDFLKEVSKVYESFIALDLSEYNFYLAQEMSFYLSLQNWEFRFRDTTKTMLFNGFSGPFAAYARERLVMRIMDDWSAFNKELEEETTSVTKMVEEFKIQTLSIINLIPTKEHLKLVADTLIKTLTRISNDEQLKLVISETRFANNGVEPLKWNGQFDTLYTLFFDLSNRMSKETNKFFIEASKDEIVSFIKANFIKPDGQPFESTSSIKTYLDPTRLDKKAKNERFVLTFNYEDPKAKK